MRAIAIHAMYGMRMTARQHGLWLKALAVVPLMEVLPFLLMGLAFIPPAEMSAYLYTNMIWSFFAAVVIQCLVAVQGLAAGGRLDAFLLRDGGLVPWLTGYSLSVCAIYLVSSIIACLLLGLGLGYPIQALIFLAYAVLSIPVTMSLVFVVLGAELRYARTFHVINLALDAFQLLSCVLFPLAALSGVMGVIAMVSPLTWLNEVVRTGSASSLMAMALTSAVILALSTCWVRLSVRRYRETGRIGG